MLDSEFCEFLEHRLLNAFANSDNEEIKHFWCDGVLMPAFESEYSNKFVNDNRKITMTAFLGLTGQDKYELTLNFGNKALSKYAKDLDISTCLTNKENSNWFDIDTTKHKIFVQLD